MKQFSQPRFKAELASEARKRFQRIRGKTVYPDSLKIYPHMKSFTPISYRTRTKKPRTPQAIPGLPFAVSPTLKLTPKRSTRTRTPLTPAAQKRFITTARKRYMKSRTPTSVKPKKSRQYLSQFIDIEDLPTPSAPPFSPQSSPRPRFVPQFRSTTPAPILPKGIPAPLKLRGRRPLYMSGEKAYKGKKYVPPYRPPLIQYGPIPQLIPVPAVPRRAADVGQRRQLFGPAPLLPRRPLKQFAGRKDANRIIKNAAFRHYLSAANYRGFPPLQPHCFKKLRLGKPRNARRYELIEAYVDAKRRGLV